MSQQNKPRQPELGAAMMDVLRRPAEAGSTPGLAAIVGNAPRTETASRPMTTAIPTSPMAVESFPKPAVRAEVAEPTSASRSNTARRGNASSTVREKIEFEIETGRGTKSVTFRVPKELAGRLKLIAVQRQLSDSEGPRTINEIGMTALLEWVERNAA